MSITLTINDDGTVQGWLTVEQFAEKENMSKAAVRRAISCGNLESLHIGSSSGGIDLICKDSKITLYSREKQEQYDNNYICDWIHTAMRNAGIKSNRELGIISGVSETTISRIFNGKYKPGMKTIASISKACGYKFDWDRL